MFPTLASVFNLLDGTHLIVLCIFGLLLFGKELPVIARKAAKQYFRYKRMINDATSDIRREMDNAADIIEEEKRKIQRDLDDDDKGGGPSGGPGSNGSKDYNPGGSSYGDNSESNGSSSEYPYGDTPPDAPESRIVHTPAKPIADPLALDVPVPSATTQRATEAARTPAASVAQLDTFQKSVPPPTNIPQPL